MSADTPAPVHACPHCQHPTVSATVRTAIWMGDRLVVVEDVPAQVCQGCSDQFYDDDVSRALRRLAEDGFPAAQAAREITVPVFSLDGRIVRRADNPADDGDYHVD